MSVLVVWSAQPGAGKTTVAAGLAQRLAFAGIQSGLVRVLGETDERAGADASFFASIPFTEVAADRAVPLTLAADLASQLQKSGAVTIIETPADTPLAELSSLSPRLVLVARYSENWEQAAQSMGEGLLGVVLTAVPRSQREAIASAVADKGLPILALLPEDRLLLSPTLEEIARALEGDVLVHGKRLDEPAENLVITPISVDQGFAHFSRWRKKVVIGRYDKPDLLLAAMIAEANCLIVTGGWPPLEYVIDRASNEAVTLMVVKTDTVTTVNKLEQLYDHTRFYGDSKLQRIGELLDASLDFDAVAEALGVVERL